MKARITIGDETYSFGAATTQWINKAFAHARQMDMLPCVIVQIDEPGYAMGLMTPGCARPGGSGGGVPLSAIQQKIHELWIRHKMTSSHYTGGNLVSFLGELERLVS